MRVSELMIGDWVYSDVLNKPYKVGRPSDFRFMYTKAYDVFDENGKFIHLHPITLTNEILDLNGIDFLSLYNNDFNDSKAFITLRTYRDNHFEVISGSMPLRYVHELQHALRLCGLSELADNFKLTTT